MNILSLKYDNKTAHQLLHKADMMKDRLAACNDIFMDNEAWANHHELQILYKDILLLDLEYALDRKVEQDLWNFGFKNQIGNLQRMIKDKKNGSEEPTKLLWFLAAASGFYLSMLQEICNAFDLDYQFRRKSSIFGLPYQKLINKPQKSSCNYVCQHCLVHLGDLARYRNEVQEAESFYRQAILPSPHSGQPYNQLAILEGSRGNKLASIFYYVRSIAIKTPFVLAASNLSNLFSRYTKNEGLQPTVKTKMSSSEYISMFLKLHAILHSGVSLHHARILVESLTTSLTALTSTESLTSWKLVQMLAINLFTLHHSTNQLDNDNDSKVSTIELSKEESEVRCLVIDLLTGTLNALLLRVYTLPEPTLEYFALPTIKLTLDVIHQEPEYLQSPAFVSRKQIWPSLCKLFNTLQPMLENTDLNQYSNSPLPEDQDLQGFIPLKNVFKEYKLASSGKLPDMKTANLLRAQRLLLLGHWLSEQDVGGEKVIVTKETLDNASHKIVFEATVTLPVTCEVLSKELTEFQLSKQSSSTETSSCSTRNSTPEVIVTNCANNENSWKKPGILKPQGSLEKAKEREQELKQVQISESQDVRIAPIQSPQPDQNLPRGRQNVAILSIFKKNASDKVDSKQVKFRTPTPPMSASPEDRESPWNITLPPMNVPPPQLPFTAFPPPPIIPPRFGPIGGNSNTGIGGMNMHPPQQQNRNIWHTDQHPPPPQTWIPFSTPPPPRFQPPDTTWTGNPSYSLFSSPWQPSINLAGTTTTNTRSVPQTPMLQSLWSGPGLTPLERLLEQQRNQRDGSK